MLPVSSLNDWKPLRPSAAISPTEVAIVNDRGVEDVVLRAEKGMVIVKSTASLALRLPPWLGKVAFTSSMLGEVVPGPACTRIRPNSWLAAFWLPALTFFTLATVIALAFASTLTE